MFSDSGVVWTEGSKCRQLSSEQCIGAYPLDCPTSSIYCFCKHQAQAMRIDWQREMIGPSEVNDPLFHVFNSTFPMYFVYSMGDIK